jgi:hypothetical protein
MGDYTDRSSPAELDVNSALSADFTIPKHTVGQLPDENQMRRTSALEELETMQGQQDDDPGYKREKTGGRQKGTPNKVARFDLAKSAKVYGLRALAVAIEIMENEKEAGPVRLAAAKEVLDRGFGKAKQVTEISGIDGEEIQSRLVIEFVGQPPIKADVQAQITDKAGEVIDLQLETIRVPENRRPWDPA